MWVPLIGLLASMWLLVAAKLWRQTMGVGSHVAATIAADQVAQLHRQLESATDMQMRVQAESSQLVMEQVIETNRYRDLQRQRERLEAIDLINAFGGMQGAAQQPQLVEN